MNYNKNYQDISLVDAFVAGHVVDHVASNKGRYTRNELLQIMSYVERLWLGEIELDKLTEDYIRGIESKALAREVVKNHKENR